MRLLSQGYYLLYFSERSVACFVFNMKHAEATVETTTIRSTTSGSQSLKAGVFHPGCVGGASLTEYALVGPSDAIIRWPR